MKMTIALLFATLATSQAAIVWSGLQNIAIPQAVGLTDLDGVFIDIDNPGRSRVNVLGASSNEVNFTLGGTGLFSSAGFLPIRSEATSTGAVVRLFPGDAVTTSDITGPTGFGANQEVFNQFGTDFMVGEEAFLGFIFTPDGATSQHAGWMRVILTNNTSGGVVRDWAFESVADSPIVVGAVPEPSTLLFGGLGLTALLLRRRRRSVFR